MSIMVQLERNQLLYWGAFFHNLFSQSRVKWCNNFDIKECVVRVNHFMHSLNPTLLFLNIESRDFTCDLMFSRHHFTSGTSLFTFWFPKGSRLCSVDKNNPNANLLRQRQR